MTMPSWLESMLPLGKRTCEAEMPTHARADRPRPLRGAAAASARRPPVPPRHRRRRSTAPPRCGCPPDRCRATADRRRGRTGRRADPWPRCGPPVRQTGRCPSRPAPTCPTRPSFSPPGSLSSSDTDAPAEWRGAARVGLRLQRRRLRVHRGCDGRKRQCQPAPCEARRVTDVVQVAGLRRGEPLRVERARVVASGHQVSGRKGWKDQQPPERQSVGLRSGRSYSRRGDNRRHGEGTYRLYLQRMWRHQSALARQAARIARPGTRCRRALPKPPVRVGTAISRWRAASRSRRWPRSMRPTSSARRPVRRSSTACSAAASSPAAWC